MRARKLSPTARGYGLAHRALTERWRPLVEAGLVRCARCGEIIAPRQAFDLGHVDGTERTVHSGPEHRFSRDCSADGNRATSRHKKQQGLG